MRHPILNGVLAALGSCLTVLTQTYIQTGPFFLRLASENATLDGQYLGACHAGAALEGLCLAGNVTPTANSSFEAFYFNKTYYEGSDPQPETGVLVWNLPYNSGNGTIEYASSGLSMTYPFVNSNSEVPLFEPGNSNLEVGFNDTKFYRPGHYDDSTFAPGQYPKESSTQLSQWYACWTWIGGYYYHGVAWITNGTPTNPTCQVVEIHQESI